MYGLMGVKEISKEKKSYSFNTKIIPISLKLDADYHIDMKQYGNTKCKISDST